MWATPSARPKGSSRARTPLETPGSWWCVRYPRRNHEGRGRSSVFSDEHGPLPLVISSQDTVLFDDVRSFAGANQSRGVRFIERFADVRSPEVVRRKHCASGRGGHVRGRYIVCRPRRWVCDGSLHQTPLLLPHRTLWSWSWKRTGRRSATMRSASQVGSMLPAAGENKTVTPAGMGRVRTMSLAQA